MKRSVTKIGRPRLSESGKKKEAILAAATKLFVANGYESTTLAEIGKAAGVTKRTIYEHVGDKETLFRTVCTECLPRSLELHFEPRLKGRTARTALKHLARLALNYSLSDENISLARMLVVERQRFPDLVLQSVLTLRELYRQLIESALNEMVDLGRLPPSKIHRAAYIFYDLVVGSVHMQMLFDLVHQPPSEAEIDERIDTFLFGYLGAKRERC